MPSTLLPTFRFADGTCIPQAQSQQPRSVTPASPALWVMTDLTEVRAATAGPELTLDQAEQTMIDQGVRMLFVVARMPCVEGIVTLAMLHGDRPMRLIQQRRVRRSDLCVADVMSKLSELDVLDLETLRRASVGDVVAALQRFGMPHLLVVEAATPQSPPRIRGIVSHTQVERQLGASLPMHPVARTFSEIEQALA
jgi:CBS-domain-containing membrane protein